MKKTRYRVSITVDVEADSVEEAARIGHELLFKEKIVNVTPVRGGTQFVHIETGEKL